MEVSFCQLTTIANHGAGQFAPRKMTLSSILYIIISEINNIILLVEIRASAYARIRGRTDLRANKKMKS